MQIHSRIIIVPSDLVSEDLFSFEDDCHQIEAMSQVILYKPREPK